ncbi:unnamed protein product [Ambrosiozyma monospora]|uniref:Unnamed protein product n=1 Tax=Ambrosiozyma monospora TaxID=43982 RepID=A0A9W6Z2Y5_AMBMO|nr:unnamed protein product [Ambrosiozyma monospora]
MASELLLYSDPLIQLLKDPNLNKEKEKTKELIQIINEITDVQVKAWCIESFEILRDLEKIELKLNNWEFQTLDFNLEIQTKELQKKQLLQQQQTSSPKKQRSPDSVFAAESEELEKRKINSELAKRVSNHCLELHKLLAELSIEIDELNSFNRQMSPLQRISDPGTILTELSLRVIKLKNTLSDEISIHYSKARLVTIGIALEKLIDDEDRTSSADSDDDGVITEETVNNYKNFINNLLLQLNECVSNGDTIGAMECISIVNDVEKMFESMRIQKLQAQQQKRLMSSEPLEKVSSYPGLTRSETPLSSSFDDTLYSGEFDEYDENAEMNKSLSTIKIGQRRQKRYNDDGIEFDESSSLQKTTISAELPGLMSAFEEAKATEEELRGALAVHAPKKQKGSRKGTRGRGAHAKLNEAALREHDKRQGSAHNSSGTDLSRTSKSETRVS